MWLYKLYSRKEIIMSELERLAQKCAYYWAIWYRTGHVDDFNLASMFSRQFARLAARVIK
ncbi:MAG: hypothetical protein A2W25_11680 [candidate division Zixibacteria bacterium RBG_16_53_22]|nr:MAG: hypothetical protein A2W25_11680 [candidate division Zixibacteria bacterium RBG_16_53_22]